MLTTRLQGGLGNQLFQVAAGETIAKQTNRKYFIESLNTESAHSNTQYFDSILKNWKHLYNPIESVVFNEANFEYIDWLPHLQFPVISLNGYFQNWRYIPDTFCERLSFDTSVLRRFPIHKQSAFLHIRGGDYKNHWVHDVGLDYYYEKAIQQFPKGTHFYVFTNDIEYAKTKTFLKSISYSFVFENEVDSLYLMSQCGVGGICANSSFSWWGAYLNRNRKIIMPSKWYNQSHFYTDGYYFDNVIKVEVERSLDFVDKVVYINLDKRTDRNQHMLSMTSIFKDKVQRFSAIEYNPGGIGCSKSHIAILEMAIQNSWKNVLILEDDAVWNNFEQGFTKLQNLINKDYDVIVLGGSFVNRSGDKLINCKSTVGYIVNSKYYKTLLENFKEGLQKLEQTQNYDLFAIDSYWQSLQQRDNWFILSPCLVYQKPDYSDICKMYLDYRGYFELT